MIVRLTIEKCPVVSLENASWTEDSVDIEAIKDEVCNGEFVVSAHADQEAADENIDIAEIRDALLCGEILEQYADTGRGPSCLILGFVNDRPIHVVCGWHHGSATAQRLKPRATICEVGLRRLQST